MTTSRKYLVVAFLCAMVRLLAPHYVYAAPQYQGSWYTSCPLDSAIGPVDVELSASGEVLVLERVKRAHRFTGTGACISNWYVSLDPSQLSGIAPTPSGGSVVVDFGTRKIRTFAPNGDPITSWGTFGNGIGQLNLPGEPAVNPNGDLLVPDVGRARVLVFTLSGTLLREWSPTVTPGRIALDDSGYVYLANPSFGTAGMFTPDGEFIRSIGTPGTLPGQHENPNGIAVSPDGLVYISDVGNNTISIFTRTGTFIERFGGPGSGVGQFDGIGRLACDQQGNLYVVDENNFRICKFGPGPSPSIKKSWGQVKAQYK